MPEEMKNETEKKDIDVNEVIGAIFSKKEEKDAEVDTSKVKKPVNIFSKPIPVTQDETAKKARLKMVIIEGLLFGAFLTSITVIYSLSGLASRLDPMTNANTPNFLFFFLEFVFFSVVIGVGDYFLTEKRVNDYNSKMAGINFDIGNEIEMALKEQEEAGITAEAAAAQNKSNGEESGPAPFLEVKCVAGEKSLTDKKFEVYLNDELAGVAETCKAIIDGPLGMQTIVIFIRSLSAKDGEFKNGVVMQLINAAKAAAAENGLAAVVIGKRVYGDMQLNISSAEKFGITFVEEIKIQEAYPGALMGVSGTLRF